ncbi:MAG TPA: hypothetical protein VG938_07885 [Verrucomicrobiae bacterium]|jgi:hypothetical protein|nr:hypothetical protein [Verrucomicrobiae bacterium]
MGLDAAVYRNVNALAERFGAEAFDVDPQTGESTPKPSTNIREPRATFVALKRRLGNFAAVGSLRAKISNILMSDRSIVLQKILYDASHGGDIIKSEDFNGIAKEIETIRCATNDPLVLTFVANIEDLINTALTENNPIVFV